MTNKRMTAPPRWLFTILMVGGLVTSGIYLGIMRAQGVSTEHLLQAIGYGFFGLFMLWGVLAERPVAS
jgi:hypothetical protein